MEMGVQKWAQMCKEFSMLAFQIRGANTHYS